MGLLRVTSKDRVGSVPNRDRGVVAAFDRKATEILGFTDPKRISRGEK